jgi:hypothetical protein
MRRSKREAWPSQSCLPLGQVRRIAVLAGWVMMVALLITPASCSFPPREQSDTRAYPGSNPDIGLEEALQQHQIVIPKGAKELRFKVSDGLSRENWLDLTFAIPCSEVPVFLKVSKFKAPLIMGYMPHLILGEARAHNWRLGTKSEQEGAEDVLGPIERYVLVRHMGQESCQLFMFSII